MGVWRNKLIFLFIVYFAGFASAIYCLAPAPDAKAIKSSKKGFAYSALKSDDFAKSFNVSMHKCLYYGKYAAKRFSNFLKQKPDKKKQQAAMAKQ
jgi:hypothetical protein